ncbi:Cof-type HAD-IIB family hydrolase [Roseburia sp. MSJ-14]|uniref:Cof-type HAD-IIB family hydrolase n=1 Tax=Roseburia sp. MSJ-14 TaxID=2841514 RepID=UPI001C10B33C|nr:Cof-type HAD-IIB family hydrolase [Roseburia sp. MSJ-14]MBU5472127.1 Cof-type HAD-IIB family hydrolase [Roseburia sp. MSJ-14]
MEQYKLIAFDMDGTLLNSQKKITDKACEAIQKAIDAGIIVILNTGRCVAELEEYMEVLKNIQYINSTSGALVYDRKSNKDIYSSALDVDTVKAILDIVSSKNVMIDFLTRESIVQRDKIEKMEQYRMEVYRDMFERVTVKWEDICGQYLEKPFPVAKLNIYHTSEEARNYTRQRIEELQLGVEMVNAETTSLEISAKGIDKGIGLEKLCQYLNISLSQTIVVGDADNDIGAMKKAGLAVAMGNANERIKELADVMVADNDHDGCREVIEKYIFAKDIER